jgi:hypothetical protein
MLDNETMTLLAKLKVAAKKTGINIDLIRMSGDTSYAATMLNELSNSEDAELVLIVVSLMNKFGMIYTPRKNDNPQEESDEDRYIGGLR